MEQRVSLITLAVGDMERSAAFYAALGWTPVESPDGVVAFDLPGQVPGLHPKADLAAIAARAVAAGAREIKPLHDVFRGGA